MKTRSNGIWPVGTPWWAEKWRETLSENSDWEKLNPEQQRAVDAWRERVSQFILAYVRQFERDYPDVRLTYNFTSEPLLRANHPATLEEL